MGVGYIQPLGSNDVYVNGGSNMPECPAPDMSPQEQACTLALMMGPLTCADTGFPTPEQCAKILANFTFTPVSIRAAFCKIFCNHFMAIPYYIGSILHREKYVGRPCESVEKCRKGETLPCPSGGCPQLGHYARFPPGDTGGPHLYHLKAWEKPLLP
ncbi:pancreatic lipase-related protein 2-like [Gastrophryne carolinensis]